MTDGRRAPHPANELNELPGEEWLYFTKSVLTTAYPSELGHALRKQHGANKPPRLMARLIEFFTKSGELFLDPFAGGARLDPKPLELWRVRSPPNTTKRIRTRASTSSKIPARSATGSNAAAGFIAMVAPISSATSALTPMATISPEGKSAGTLHGRRLAPSDARSILEVK